LLDPVWSSDGLSALASRLAIRPRALEGNEDETGLVLVERGN